MLPTPVSDQALARGLCIGPVILAVVYPLFWKWARDRPHVGGPGSQQT